MGNIETKPSNCAEQPWWSIENEIFSLNQPNLNDIIATINEPDEIRYPTVREKILAKLRDRKYSSCSDSEDQSNNGEQQNNNINKFYLTSRSSSESDPNDLLSTSPQTDTTTVLADTLTVPQTLEEFREELRTKRIARQTVINDLRSELYTLRKQLKDERELNRKLKNGNINILIEMKDESINTENINNNNNDDNDDDDNNDHCNDGNNNNNVMNLYSTTTDNLNNINCDNKNDKNNKLNENNNNNNDNKFTKKSFCDICVQTDPIQISTNNNEINNTNTSTFSNDNSSNNNRRYNRASNDTQQINLKAQLAELQLSLQLANADNLSLTTELAVVKKQVASLKEVISCSRQMIDVREEQVQQLKAKLRQIEESLADRELKIMSENLRQEYDRQLANIRNLRQLYEERARVSAAERENLLRQIAIKKDELSVEILKVKTMEERITTLENELTASKDKLNETKAERDNLYVENKSLKEEMSVINKLFSQMLTGFNGRDNLDIDRLTTMLEENRTLLNEIAINETNSEGASLPKLLFDLMNQANKNEDNDNNCIENIENDLINVDVELTNDKEFKNDFRLISSQEIIGNLPKVWKILIEFLNHQKVEKVEFEENGQSEECYKFVQTSTGTRPEISVSKTYLKLKDLILEKKSLMKETNRLKTLNSHLEHRLDEQEKRLSVVSLELTKTWHLVGKMQRQHRQLHTHEQILRYHLQQKKRLLNELKEELEYCRRKWAAARAKNAESQIQCDVLRKEFASRKLMDANNSAESGYSDGPGSSDEESSPKEKKSFTEFLGQPRKIERSNSISPVNFVFEEAVVRSSSAPPVTTFLTELLDTADEIATHQPPQSIASTSTEPDQAIAKTTLPPPASAVARDSSGAIPKQGVKSIKLSRGRKLESYTKDEKDTETLEEVYRRLSDMKDEEDNIQPTLSEDDSKRNDRVERINRLEEQCKSLIAQVIETSDNREKLQVQFCQFQSEIEPAQHPVPFEEYLSRKRSSIKDTAKDLDKMNPKTDEECLTPKETEYTNRRSERLKQLEEESNQLMSRIKRTADRGNNMKTLLEKIHSRCTGSREGSFDSCHSTDDTDCEVDNLKVTGDSNQDDTNCIERESSDSCRETPVRLTPEEEAYTTRRSERLKRLEDESKLLMTKLSRHSQRGTRMNSRIDALHLRYGSEDSDAGSLSSDIKDSKLNKENSNMISNVKEEVLGDLKSELDDVKCEGASASALNTEDVQNDVEENEMNLTTKNSEDFSVQNENDSTEKKLENNEQNRKDP